MLTFSLLDFLSYNGNSIYIYVILIVIIIIGYYIYFVPFTWIEVIDIWVFQIEKEQKRKTINNKKRTNINTNTMQAINARAL